MDNMNEVLDVKVMIRRTLHNLTSIKELLGQTGNERRRTRQEFCLITGFTFRKIPKVDTFNGLQNHPFCDRVFPDKIAEPLNKVRVSEVLEVIRSPEMWSALSDEDSVKVCLLLLEQQSKQVFESVLVFTSEELVAEYHSITISVQLIENVGDGDPLIFLKELTAVKQRMNTIERFIKSKSNNLSEDSVANNLLKKKLNLLMERCFIGEISCENLGQEQLQSHDMYIQSIGKQFVQHPLESPNEKRLEISISDVLNGEVSFDKKRPNIYHGEFSKNEALFEEFDPKEYDKNVHGSGDEKIRFIVHY
uniref:Uncharacterized protein n=1 Tax=Tanacetum cinerariifolium TaxID=118510 RepID=A0A6L2MY18_TANCI|nr:hypothetical protein [Tanacetum cinerariifolium]